MHTDVALVLRPDDMVLYFGDWDLAGDDIEGNTQRVLELKLDSVLRWERLALTTRQVERYNLPTIIKEDRIGVSGMAVAVTKRWRVNAVKATIVAILRRRLDQLRRQPLRRQRRAIARKLGA